MAPIEKTLLFMKRFSLASPLRFVSRERSAYTRECAHERQEVAALSAATARHEGIHSNGPAFAR